MYNYYNYAWCINCYLGNLDSPLAFRLQLWALWHLFAKDNQVGTLHKCPIIIII